MFQSNIASPTVGVKEIFDNIIKALAGTVGDSIYIGPKYTSEWDMKATYYPIHACIWNDIDKINSPCKIISKDSQFALVVFSKNKSKSGDNYDLKKELPGIIYRLEDLI